jgi:RNA polymerase sigma factor (sigma-70 family)
VDDASLLRAADRGDPEAFSVFYRRHLSGVLGFALRATRDPEVAADLAAEVFATALAACGRYEPQYTSALPWLLGIAKNKLRESQRRGRVEDATRRQLQMTALPFGDEDRFEVERTADLDASEVVAAIDGLPLHEREAVRARVLNEQAYREIAIELDCSESVVRQRVSRGLARLRGRLASGTENS